MSAILYHRPFNCSLAVLIAAAQAGVELEIDMVVDNATKALASGGSLLDINPLGQVSTIRLETGELLTETSACLLWVQSQSKRPFHIDASDPRYFQMVRWLGFVATELHKQALRVVYYSEATDDVKDNFRALVPARLELLDNHLANRDYLLGNDFSAADAYLTWFLLHAERAKVAAPGLKHLKAYEKRVMARPKVQAAIAEDQARMETVTT